MMFADDLLLYKPISQPNDFQAVQEDITDVEKWSTLNPSKCKYLMISRKSIEILPCLGTPHLQRYLERVQTFACKMNGVVPLMKTC